MKKLLPLMAAGAVALGLWSGWRAGAGAQARGDGPVSAAGWVSGPGQNSTATLAGRAVPGSVTLHEWRDLTGGDPGESRTGEAAHMARVRQLARGLSLEDLLDRIGAGMEEATLKNSSSAILGALIQELARRDAAQACDLLLRKNHWRPDGGVFEEWGRQDPQAAFAWLDAHPEFQKQRYQIIRGWAETHPEAAFEMLVDLSRKGRLKEADAGSATEESRFTFIPLWAKKDPEAAVAACISHPDLDFCRFPRWAHGLAQDIGPDQRERLISAIRTITDPFLRASAFSECAAYFAVSDDPLKAIPFTEDSALSDSDRERMRRRVLDMWVTRADAEAGARWFWNSSPPGQRAAALQDVLVTWTSRAGHLSKPLEWLQSLPPDQLPADAPGIFAMAGFPVDPVPAPQGWLALQPTGEVTSEAAARLGQGLSSAPQASRLPALLREAGFSVELAAGVLTAAGQVREWNNTIHR